MKKMNGWEVGAIILIALGYFLALIAAIQIVTIVAHFNELSERDSTAYALGSIVGRLILPALALGIGYYCKKRATNVTGDVR